MTLGVIAVSPRCPADGRVGIAHDRLQTDEHQPWVCTADPAVAGCRPIAQGSPAVPGRTPCYCDGVVGFLG
jgi:hypothetical protein